MPAECTAPNCTSDRYCRDLCTLHYQRLRRTGRLDQPSTTDRLLARVAADDDGCWLWTGATTAAGYGVLSVDDRLVYAHRLSYEIHVGPIPDDLTIDHLCRKPRRVRPACLEPVTRAENTRRELLVRHQ
jgi:hypothetical protein